MGPENPHPLDELKLLDLQVDQVTDLAGLKPMFFRLDEIAREHPADFDIQLSVSELKQKIVARGTVLKQQATTAEMRESPPTLKLPALPKLPSSQTWPPAAPPPVPAAFQAPPEPLEPADRGRP